MTKHINLPPYAVAGYFTLDARKVDDNGRIISTRRLAGPFKNIETDTGLDRMGANADWLTYCQVGTGNTAPSASDTSLAAFLVSSGDHPSGLSSRGAQGSAPYYAWHRIVYRFGTGVAAGNIAEVGIGWVPSGSGLYSRALILDSGGSPTTITVQADEVLDVTYEWRVYPPTSDVVDTDFDVGGVLHDITVRAAAVTTIQPQFGTGWGIYAGSFSSFATNGVTASIRATNQGNSGYTGTIGAITGTPAGSAISSTSTGSTAYGASDLARDGTITWGTAVENDIRSALFTFNWCAYQVQFDPAIDKNAGFTLELTFRHSWVRATIP
jgi:hypothetical protein